MSLSPNFSATESLGNPSDVTISDVSSGSDTGLTSRRVYCRLANGNWLTEAGESTTEAYETWNINDTSITLSLLRRSTAAELTVKLMTNTTVSYTKTINYVFNLYDYLFSIGLISDQASTLNPNILQDVDFYNNCIRLIVNIDNSENAISYGDSITSSQFALDRNQFLILNQSINF